MTMPFAALARARARMGEGQLRGEQERYGRDQDEQQRLFREWATRQQMDAQNAERDYRHERDQTQDARYNADRDATMGRQREQDQFSAMQAGGTDAPEMTAAQALAGMNAMNGGGGNQAFRPQAPRTTPFQQNVAGVDIKAPDMGGPQYATRGGRTFKFDKQQAANVAAQGEAQDVSIRDAQEKRADTRMEARDARSMARQLAAIRATQQGQGQGKPANDGERQAATFYERMVDSDGIVGQLGAPTKGDDVKEGILPDFAAKYVRNDDQRARLTAQRNFVTAVLRKESGASISPAEFEDAARIYFPQTGDSPDLIAQKARNRQIVIEGMARQAGRAASSIAPTPAMPAATAGDRMDAIVSRFHPHGSQR